MTLQEKFHQWLKTEPFGSKERPTLREAQCEKIADEYAIEYSEWLLKQFIFSLETGVDSEADNAKEMLEIFKKEKGW